MPLNFVDRHNGPRESQEKEMLKTLGLSSLEELIDQTVPKDIQLKEPLQLDEPLSEYDYIARLKAIAAKNKNFRSMIGMGFYGTASPAVITRNIFENPSWYTSYTPYQAEISQGRLEALINFQTMISSLTGFGLSNCSMLDDATATAEAMRMMFELRSRDAVKEGKNILFVDDNIFPQTLSVLKTRSAALGIELEIGRYSDFKFNAKCFGAILQYPAANGEVRDYRDYCEKAHQQGILVAAYCDLLALAILTEPAAWGADIVTGSAQRFGLPMGFGGPTAGYMATSDKFKRNLPGRIIGLSIDRLGKPAVRLALQTREQHIKREKATSNICTATALMATMAGMFAVYHGPKGIKEIATDIYAYSHAVALMLKHCGYEISCDKFFDTIEIANADVEKIRTRALAAGFNFNYFEKGKIRISFDELSSQEEAFKIIEIFEAEKSVPYIDESPLFMKRESDILTSEVFGKYHSETEMMRYIKKLERRDVSLTHSMIPLGSCTMKLNAAVEMMPLSWSEFGNVHPFAPSDQVEGTLQIIREVEHDLATITGFDGCSLQPNSGAAGEYAGLMTIRAYHHAHNESHRNIMIIPTSAHGTNPASAAMAGFGIVLVGCDDHGNINVEELREKAETNKNNLAGMMITYPSTHGVFEVKIREIVKIIHENGGLLYMDGANMNAQVGITNPGFIGADVCHLNLHKTFAMPHGGGGPGVGPICTAKHLTPFLPGHPVVKECGGKNMTAVSAAPYGSPLLLPITHAYIKLLGASGLRKASEIAILNANYMSAKLMPELKTLYTGATGRVAHECIIDLQHFRTEYGVDATDIAKRLMDFGFHAPTLSFPVHETLMIEPTESEPLAELDRFVDTLKCIVAECEDIKAGRLDKEDNPVKMAPHTADEVCANEWKHPYSREQAAFPLEWIRDNKLWPFVARVDNGYGDRNLVTTV
ncbi:MAG: aminomethyl-transferring glycine dehydrogenase [Bacteroidales bacterium]|nr:aminomethyl-transferring glycine dehydrogenase [Bacteroidales bacterium]MDD4670087.1 aminomethyl-transferring glycine dehydrogenase [Bacteroidales bacterium]